MNCYSILFYSFNCQYLTVTGVRMNKRPLLSCCTSCKCSMENFRESAKRWNTLTRSIYVMRARVSVMSRTSVLLHWSCSTTQVGGGSFILFCQFSVHLSTIELPKRQFQMFSDISLSEKLIWKWHHPQNINKANPWHIVWAVNWNAMLGSWYLW